MRLKLQILQDTALIAYKKQLPASIKKKLDSLHDAELSTKEFSFYTSVASVFSSKIEGEHVELDSYIKHKRFGVAFLPDYTKKIDDLYEAYTFAQTHQLNQHNIAKAHTLLARHLLSKTQLGVLRKGNMYVTTPDGKIEYVAAEPRLLFDEMQKLYADIKTLLAAELDIKEVFYFAAMLHLVFVKIHPFADGNGRTARLLEKWFLARKLGNKAWYIPGEKYYYQQHKTYYNNIRKLGLEYAELEYSKALPFLCMLPQSLG